MEWNEDSVEWNEDPVEWYGDTLPVEKYPACDMAWVARIRKIWGEMVVMNEHTADVN